MSSTYLRPTPSQVPRRQTGWSHRINRPGSARAMRTLSVLMLTWLLFISGCDTGQQPPTEVKIGAVYPLSGDLEVTGIDTRRGIELAAEVINGRFEFDMPLAQMAGLPNLKGAKIKVVFADHAGKPEQAASEVKHLLEDEKVVALMGCYVSSVTARASQVAEQAGVPFLSPIAASPSLTERGYRWYFRTGANDSTYVSNFFDFLVDLQKQRGIALGPVAIVYENSLWGTGTATLVRQYAQRAGLKVAADIPYQSTTKDVKTEVQQIIAAGASLVMQTSYDSDSILFMQTYKTLRYRPQAILGNSGGFISPGFVKTLGKDANYLLSREVWAADLGKTRPLVKQINALFRQRYGVDMTGNSARSFTGLIVLADAINRAGSTNPEAIRQALLQTDLPAQKLIMPWDGVRFDPATGQNISARGIIVQIQDQAYYTVWPWSLATHDLVWPMPGWEK